MSEYDYSVVPFTANIQQQQGSREAASQLQAAINSQAQQGWDFVRLESVETYVQGDSGCLGIGATPAAMQHYKIIVLRRRK